MNYEQKFIEIPFGANDSELKGWEYTIPDGMEAIVKDGKVIVREKESKDEKIKKRIEQLIRLNTSGLEKTHLLTWLEKQKEKGRNITANLLEDGITGVQRELIEFLANNIDTSWVDVIKSADAYAQRIRSMFEKQKEQKPIDVKERPFQGIVVDKLKYIVPSWYDGAQKPAEWSEEDETFVKDAIEAVENYYSKGCGQEELVSWLKSLRPKPHWKPSEKQKELKPIPGVKKVF